jgi:1-phosphofructokinase family hexose kinase
MILCAVLSPALDVTYHVDRLQVHDTNRVRTIASRAGGKAVNVARLLRALDEPVTLIATIGGPTGELFAHDLQAAGLAAELVRGDLDTRRTVTVVADDTGDATVFCEPATHADWDTFLERTASSLHAADLVVASGSLPRGVPVDGYAALTRLARDRGVPIIVDTSGPALIAALDAGPQLVKPNLSELIEVTGIEDPLRAATRVARSSGGAVVASLGADGLLAVTPHGAWRATLSRQLRGNPTGAGDAVVAALARGLLAGADWPQLLTSAAALSGAAVLAPCAGEFSADDYAELIGTISVEQLAEMT